MTGVGEESTLQVLKREQLNQAVQTYKTQFSLLVQVGTVLVTASLSVLALGVNAKSGIIVFLSPLFLFALIVMFKQSRVAMKPVVFSAVSLEHDLGLGSRGLAGTFIGQDSSTEYVNEILRIDRMEDVQRANAISRLRAPNLGPISKTMYLVFWSFFTVVLGFAVAALVGSGLKVFGWSFF